MNIIDRIDNFLNRDETTTTPDVEQNLAKGHVDVIGEVYRCPYCGFERAVRTKQGMGYCDACDRAFRIVNNKAVKL